MPWHFKFRGKNFIVRCHLKSITASSCQSSYLVPVQNTNINERARKLVAFKIDLIGLSTTGFSKMPSTVISVIVTPIETIFTLFLAIPFTRIYPSIHLSIYIVNQMQKSTRIGKCVVIVVKHSLISHQWITHQ